jgi:hypothetical protein
MNEQSKFQDAEQEHSVAEAAIALFKTLARITAEIRDCVQRKSPMAAIAGSYGASVEQLDKHK